MSDKEGLHDLEDVIERLQSMGDGSGQISIGDIQEEVGQRSFGPLMVVLGLIVLSPIGGIPGVPTIFGIIVFLIAGQLLIGKRHFWLPGFITRRSIKAERLNKGAKKMRPMAKWVDRFLRPRLVILTRRAGTYLVAACCAVIAVVMPFLEVVPFVAAAPAFAVTAFGLALIADDGALAALGYIATAVSLYLIVRYVPIPF